MLAISAICTDCFFTLFVFIFFYFYFVAKIGYIKESFVDMASTGYRHKKKGNKLKHRLLPFNIVRANGQMLLQKFQTHKSKV